MSANQRGGLRTAVLLMVLVTVVGGCATSGRVTALASQADPASQGASPSRTPATAAMSGRAPSASVGLDPLSGMRWIAPDHLPPEAIETLARIDEGGPFPFDRDGATFENREGLLPRRARGHYREYTVVTPGSDDRGARRIVAGADDERYYTADHYDSFLRILPP